MQPTFCPCFWSQLSLSHATTIPLAFYLPAPWPRLHPVAIPWLKEGQKGTVTISWRFLNSIIWKPWLWCKLPSMQSKQEDLVGGRTGRRWLKKGLGRTYELPFSINAQNTNCRIMVERSGKSTKRATKLIDRQTCLITRTYPSIPIFE